MHTHIPSSYSLIHTFTRSSHFIYFFKRNESSEHNESGALSHLEHKKCCTSSKTLSDIYIRFSTSKHRAEPCVCVLCLAVSLFHLRSLSPIFLLWSCGLAFIVLHNLHSALIYHFIHLLTHSKILVIRYNDRRFYSLFPPNQMCECVCVCVFKCSWPIVQSSVFWMKSFVKKCDVLLWVSRKIGNVDYDTHAIRSASISQREFRS